MSTRNDIIKQMVTDLRVKIDPVRSDIVYSTGIGSVMRGNIHFEDMKDMPCVVVANDEDEHQEDTLTMGDNAYSQVRYLNFYLYGRLERDQQDEDADDLHNFLNDLEKFFRLDFTYKNDTTIGDIGYKEVESTDEHFFWDMDIAVGYRHDTL